MFESVFATRIRIAQLRAFGTILPIDQMEIDRLNRELATKRVANAPKN